MRRFFQSFLCHIKANPSAVAYRDCMKKSLALAALASGVASFGLVFFPTALPYTPLVVGALATVGVGLLITSR